MPCGTHTRARGCRYTPTSHTHTVACQRCPPWLLAPICAPAVLLTCPPSAAARALADVLAPVVRSPLGIPFSTRILGAGPLCTLFYACSLSDARLFDSVLCGAAMQTVTPLGMDRPLVFACCDRACRYVSQQLAEVVQDGLDSSQSFNVLRFSTGVPPALPALVLRSAPRPRHAHQGMGGYM